MFIHGISGCDLVFFLFGNIILDKAKKACVIYDKITTQAFLLILIKRTDKNNIFYS